MIKLAAPESHSERAHLISPPRWRLHGCVLANAMLMSTFLDKTIELPLDPAIYEGRLREKIAQ